LSCVREGESGKFCETGTISGKDNEFAKRSGSVRKGARLNLKRAKRKPRQGVKISYSHRVGDRKSTLRDLNDGQLSMKAYFL
jgi:hypothetical protein